MNSVVQWFSTAHPREVEEGNHNLLTAYLRFLRLSILRTVTPNALILLTTVTGGLLFTPLTPYQSHCRDVVSPKAVDGGGTQSS
jgi:hypothetical protein